MIGTAARAVTIFGSAHPIPGDADYDLAYGLGSAIARAGYTLCNGGYAGIMEASARGAVEALSNGPGGEPRTIGVTCRIFGDRRVNRWIDREIQTESLMDRLLTLIDLGSAYVVLRGGTGTLLELAAVWEMTNKRMIVRRPIILVGEFWDPVVSRVTDQLLREAARGSPAMPYRTPDVAGCVDILLSQVKGTSDGK